MKDITPCLEKGATIFLPLTLPNAEFFHRQTCQWICSKAIITYAWSNHSSNVSLHYLAKCLCSKMAVLQSWVERTAMQNSTIWNSCWNIFTRDVSTILLTDEKRITVVTQKNLKNHQLYCIHNYSYQEERCHNKTHTFRQFRQSLMASVGESQVVEKIQVWYL